VRGSGNRVITGDPALGISFSMLDSIGGTRLHYYFVAA
jgi:hypothetical protein